MAPKRVRFGWRNRKRLEAWEEAVGKIRQLHERSKAMGLPNVARFHNASLFVLLIDQDLHWLVVQMHRALDEVERLFVARQMAVLLYEAAEDLPQVFGKDYRESLQTLHLEGDFLQDINSITKQVNDFKKKHSAHLKEIRSAIGAHREHDAIAQLDLIETIRPLVIMQLGVEISVPIRALAEVLIKLTVRAGGFDVLLRDYLRKNGSIGSTQ